MLFFPVYFLKEGIPEGGKEVAVDGLRLRVRVFSFPVIEEDILDTVFDQNGIRGEFTAIVVELVVVADIQVPVIVRYASIKIWLYFFPHGQVTPVENNGSCADRNVVKILQVLNNCLFNT